VGAHYDRVGVFVDWDSARRYLGHSLRHGRENYEERTIHELQDVLVDLISQFGSNRIFRAHMRIYHGWYSGKSKTEDRRKIDSLVGKLPPRRGKNVSFPGDFVIADELMCGGERCKLFDTMRKRQDDDKLQQKMVDSALVCDLLQATKNREFAYNVVVAEDDDMLPGVIVAEKWGAKVIVARHRTDDNRHLNTAGLIRHLGRKR